MTRANPTPQEIAALEAALDKATRWSYPYNLRSYAPTIRALIEEREQLFAEIKSGWPDPDDEPEMSAEDKAELEADHQEWLKARQAKADAIKAAGRREAFAEVRAMLKEYGRAHYREAGYSATVRRLLLWIDAKMKEEPGK